MLNPIPHPMTHAEREAMALLLEKQQVINQRMGAIWREAASRLQMDPAVEATVDVLGGCWLVQPIMHTAAPD